MMEYRFINTIIRSVPVVLHLIAFRMLLQIKYTNKFNQVQRFYLLNLSLLEMVVCILSIAEGHILNDSTTRFYICAVQKIGVAILVLLSYTALTLDRFLVSYLHLRYTIVVTLQRGYLLYTFFYSFTCGVVVMVCFFHQKDPGQLSYHAVVYVWMPADILFTIVSTATYTYILLAKKNARENSGQINDNNFSSYKIFSTLLILSFVVTYIIPDIVLTTFSLTNTTSADAEFFISVLSSAWFSMGYCIDAFIYILSLKSIYIPSSLCNHN